MIGCIGTPVVLVFWLWDYLNWRSELHSDTPKIAFEQFKSLYVIAPEKWSQTYRGLFYLEKKETGDYFRSITTIETLVEFKTYHDYKQFLRFMSDIKKKKTDLKRLRKEAELVNSWQRDINNYREKANAELKEIAERIKYEQTQTQETEN